MEVQAQQGAPNQQLSLNRLMELALFDAETGLVFAYADKNVRFNRGRTGGFFHIDIPGDVDWKRVWYRIGAATESNQLGYKSSTPLPARNRDFAEQINADPHVHPIWVHTTQSMDDIDINRVYNKLMELGICETWIRNYKTYNQCDARRRLNI